MDLPKESQNPHESEAGGLGGVGKGLKAEREGRDKTKHS